MTLRSAQPGSLGTPAQPSSYPQSDTDSKERSLPVEFARKTASHGIPLLLDIETVAECLGISMRQVRRMVAEARIPYVRIGGLIRFDPDEIVQWIDERRVAGRSEAR